MCLVVTTGVQLIAQSHIGSGHSTYLNGTNSYIDAGDIYNDLVLPATIEAWVKISDNQNDWGPVLISQEGTTSTYYGIRLSVKKDGIHVSYGDGNGGNHPAFRRSKLKLFSYPISERWIHISATIKSKLDMDIVMNGIDVGGIYTGYSNDPMKNRIGSNCIIGKNNQNNHTFWYKGEIDEIRLWNYARTIKEVRGDMTRKITPEAPGLIGYWNFDSSFSGSLLVENLANKKFIGTMKGQVLVGFSGAPIGNKSTYLYESSLTGKELSIQHNNKTFTISDISSDPEGVHLYLVNSLPNSISGLDEVCIPEYYIGVFTGDTRPIAMSYKVLINNTNNFFTRLSNDQLD